MERLFWICIAGGLGTGTRYLVGLWAGRVLGTAFPWGTFIVNLVGSFLIAAVMQLAVSSSFISPTVRLSLTAGFLGGLTTYSSFNFETTKLLQERAWTAGLMNLGVTIGACFIAGLLGVAFARRLLGS